MGTFEGLCAGQIGCREVGTQNAGAEETRFSGSSWDALPLKLQKPSLSVLLAVALAPHPVGQDISQSLHMFCEVPVQCLSV